MDFMKPLHTDNNWVYLHKLHMSRENDTFLRHCLITINMFCKLLINLSIQHKNFINTALVP